MLGSVCIFTPSFIVNGHLCVAGIKWNTQVKKSAMKSKIELGLNFVGSDPIQYCAVNVFPVSFFFFFLLLLLMI